MPVHLKICNLRWLEQVNKIKDIVIERIEVLQVQGTSRIERLILTWKEVSEGT